MVEIGDLCIVYQHCVIWLFNLSLNKNYHFQIFQLGLFDKLTGFLNDVVLCNHNEQQICIHEQKGYLENIDLMLVDTAELLGMLIHQIGKIQNSFLHFERSKILESLFDIYLYSNDIVLYMCGLELVITSIKVKPDTVIDMVL